MFREWRGRVVDPAGRPVEGVTVVLEDLHARPRARLAEAATGRGGGFVLRADVGHATIGLGLYGRLGLRPLAREPMPVPAGGGTLPDLAVDARLADGWASTRMGHEPVRRTGGNEVEVLFDDGALAAVERALEGARERIHLTQLLFFPGFSASPPGHEARPLLDVLVRAARRGVRVRILLNQNAVVPDTSLSLERAARAAGADGLEVRAFPMSPNVLHSKILVVDDREAFLVGPPFQQRYWDTDAHRPTEARRGPHPPLHDASVRIRGPAVGDLHEIFARLWNQRADAAHGGADRIAPIARPPAAGDTTLQIVQTLPPRLLSAEPRGEASLLESYLRAIEQARDLIYFESQYFTSPSIAESLARALRARPGLQVILVLNETTDVPTYTQWQKRRLAEMGYPRTPGLGVFTLVSADADGGTTRPVYAHTKLGIVDDAWATIGSANLDSISFETSDEFALPIEANVDCNAVILDGIDGAPATGEVAALRRRVFAEHLGDAEVWRGAAPPPGGWLAAWQRVAEENLERRRAGKPLVAHAVPYLPPELAHP